MTNVIFSIYRLNNAYLKDIYDSRIGPTKVLAEAIAAASKPPQAFVSMSGVGE